MDDDGSRKLAKQLDVSHIWRFEAMSHCGGRGRLNSPFHLSFPWPAKFAKRLAFCYMFVVIIIVVVIIVNFICIVCYYFIILC